ncbi:MAG: hypothetical protein JSS37_04165 [Proteobacteria bacterium]|nr:hypothetical protein [Pseudomonadota bacterium]
MTSIKYSELVTFLKKNFKHLEFSSASGENLSFPDFDLMPFDYLEFAELELEKSGVAAKINCISHLKRAVECQLDTLLGILGASKIATNLPSKLEFASEAGIISSRSLAKINKIRNRVEHEYAEPNTNELEAYYDIASGFIHTLEGHIFILAHQWEIDWISKEDAPSTSFRAAICMTPPSVKFELQDGGINRLHFEATSLKEYCQGLRVYFLLCRAHGLLSVDYMLSKLE